ncbi:hypothetical protein LB823_08500 [Tsukamurella sp. M9C]|uniref:hypothetical protein n=1 Tax=Tsukamurella sp. M9C TaxID=2877520 RepID=UPI001CD01887|nr:hypothetical protein [Tsukamurella sp. M9C]MCA0156236.1 hypothetical protein [Tsukamurella sp. M9C]
MTAPERAAPAAPNSRARLVDAVCGGLLLVAFLAFTALTALFLPLGFAMASDPCAYEDCSSEGHAVAAMITLWIGSALGAATASVGYGAALARRRSTLLWPFLGFAVVVVSIIIGVALASPVREVVSP